MMSACPGPLEVGVRTPLSKGVKLQAKRTEEVRALKERHQKEVAALEQQLQEAASKPRKRAKKGRAGRPGSGESALPGAALQQENAALRQRAQELQLAA